MKFFRKPKLIQREDGIDYLKRWTLFTCRLFSIKLHKIMSSDYDCVHDHPWSFLSIILWGGYIEYRHLGTHPILGGFAQKIVTSKRIVNPGSILYRKATDKHKLEIYQTAWTLVITFKKVREWGFWTRHGFIPWMDYSSSNRCDV